MKVKMFLVVALAAASLVLIFGGMKQAYAYNLIVANGTHHIENIVKPELYSLNHKQEQQKEIQVQERDKGRKVEDIEPAAGE